MAGRGKSLDFDVVSEPWNKYEITNDGTILKTKYIMKSVFRIMRDDKAQYTGDGQPLSVIVVPENLRKEPDTKTYSPEELKKSIIKDDMRYRTLAEEWNEYQIDDGANVRVKTTVTRIARTSKFDRNGDPIYLVDTNLMIQVKGPKIPR